jgi:hypothetical protein
MCLGVKHILTNGGDCKGWSPMTPKCTPTLGIALVWELWMFKTLIRKANKHQIGPPRHHYKGLETYILKVPSHYSFWPNLHELWSQKRAGVNDRKPLESRGQMSSDWGVLYTMRNIFLRAIRNFTCILKQTWFEKDMSIQNFGTIRVLLMGLPFGNLKEKWHLDVVPTEKHKV